jgi:hypothetical protein
LLPSPSPALVRNRRRAEACLDNGSETALEALSTTCYYLSAEKNRYRFSLSPNLNKLLADRRASVQSPRVEERIRAEVQKVFADEKKVVSSLGHDALEPPLLRHLEVSDAVLKAVLRPT